MKGNAKDYVSTAQQFFTAHDAHGVDGMLGLCADGALGRYAHTAAKASCRYPWWHRFSLARVSECRSELFESK
jgi:hypothetical protein